MAVHLMLGGTRDGQAVEVLGDRPYIVMPVEQPPYYRPLTLKAVDEALRTERYDRVRLIGGNSASSIEYEVFVCGNIDVIAHLISGYKGQPK